MKLIPYAGFDPTEDDFTGVELRPLELEPARYTRINIRRVWKLRREGKNWKEIGQILAREEGRPASYHAHSIYTAANYGVQK